MEIIGTSAGDLFLKSVRAILSNGVAASPRRQPTRELTGVQLRVMKAEARLVGPETGRRLNPAFAVAEALWILSGSNASWIHDYNSRLHQYVGEGSPPGAYGPRVRSWGPNGLDQLMAAYHCLVDDPESRRAVIQIFDPAIDPGEGIDVPCTLSYRFLVRSSRLHMFVTMRSQDVWLGLPYDIFSATVIMEVMAGWLGADIGELTVSIDSFHLYERDISKATDTFSGVASDRRTLRTLSVLPSQLNSTIEHVLTNSSCLTDGWCDAARILASYRLSKVDANGAIKMARAVAGPLGEAAVDLYRLRGDRR